MSTPPETQESRPRTAAPIATRKFSGASLALAVAAGILFAFSLPPHFFAPLGWVALSPLLIAVMHPKIAPGRSLYRFGLGLITGVVAGLSQVGWAPWGKGVQFALLPYLWIAMVLGAVSVFAGRFSERSRTAWFGAVIPVSCAGVAVEWLTTFTPLPVTIALSQSHCVTVIQIASITGIWGVSLLLWVSNAAVADLALRRGKAVPSVAIAIGLAATNVLWGTIHTIVVGLVIPHHCEVAAIQDYNGMDAPDASIAPAQNAANTPEKEDLIRQAGRKGAQLIVTSEECWGSAFTPNDPKDDVAKLARETGAIIVPGFERRTEIAGEDRSWNCAALVTPEGRTIGIHHKIFPFLGERQAVRPGDRASAWDTEIGKVGLLICFDNCYTGPARQCVKAGAQIIAQPNYDPPVSHSVLHDLHAAMTPFRAVENEVAIVRADPNGRSQIVDAFGDIIAEAGMYKADAIVSPVHIGYGEGTFFTRFGDWLAYLCAAFTVFSVIAPGKAKRLPGNWPGPERTGL